MDESKGIVIYLDNRTVAGKNNFTAVLQIHLYIIASGIGPAIHWMT